MTKITVITSDKNSAWASMQEIVPHLNQMWLSLDEHKDVEVKLFNIDNCNFKQLLGHAMVSDVVVMTIFTLPLLNFVKMLRGQLNIQFRFIFHLHGFATFACWPLYYWGLGELLLADDIFIASSEADKKIMDSVFMNARTVVIPFSLNPLPLPAHLVTDSQIPVLYIGRISEQKHLELALISFKQVVDQGHNVHFHIYGQEDRLGSPHMGRSNREGYQNFLEQLVVDLDLVKDVTFYGFVKREKIDQRWQKHKTILLIPSLHSDENFGMSAFRYLAYGHHAVLSAWGGHRDLIVNFPQQVYAVDVRGGFGPWIAVSDLTDVLCLALANYHKNTDSQIPERYEFSHIKHLYQDIISLPKKSGILIRPQLIEKILNNLEKFRQSEATNDSCQIFTGYDDPLAQVFFTGYGML